MKIKSGKVKTEIETQKYIVFFSYNLPVAFYDKRKGKYYRTEKFHSRTTTKHISQFIGHASADLVPQAMLENLIEEIEI